MRVQQVGKTPMTVRYEVTSIRLAADGRTVELNGWIKGCAEGLTVWSNGVQESCAPDELK